MEEEIVYSTHPEDFDYMRVNVPCQEACPVQTNIPAYIRALFAEQPGQSYAINQAVNILPGVLGRICSRPCEQSCRHGEAELGKPVNICHLKRAAADSRDRAAQPLIQPQAANGYKVAIVGSGPAGLAAAHDLALNGFAVTIFEALDRPGGMLRYGIPEFRLPRRVLQEEIANVLGLGIELKTGIRVGTDRSLDSLLKEYQGVFLAAGCYEANELGVEGESLPGVLSGLEFMMDVCSGYPREVGRKVLVIGAGFTAFDCARFALRLGASEVTMCLRRTEEDLRVTRSEILETRMEGIKIETLMQARHILGSDRVKGVEFLRSRPGALRADNKREIAAIPGSEFSLEADCVIVATGQRQSVLPVPGGQEGVDQELGQGKAPVVVKKMDGLYLGGDYLTGPTTVIEAIASGRRAVKTMARDLSGKSCKEPVVRMQAATITDRKRAWDFIPPVEMPTISPPTERLQSMDLEVETGYARQEFIEEAKRCYLCYLHYEIDLSRCIYCRYCIDVAPRNCIKLVKQVVTNDNGAIVGLEETSSWKEVQAVVIDNSRCIRCGECVRVCPMDCIAVSRVERTERFHKAV